MGTNLSEKPSVGASEHQNEEADAQSDRRSDVTAVDPSSNNEKIGSKERADGKIVLEEAEYYNQLGFGFPQWKKWAILTTIFMVQISMNVNAAMYGNAVNGIQEEYQIGAQKARVGSAVFLICYAFGCELWAAPSEEFGRWKILQLSLTIVNLLQIMAALAPNYATLVAARILGGFASAGGSVTLGIIADMFPADSQQFAVNFIVFSSVGGSVVGPIAGAFIEARYFWRWLFWTQMIVGFFVQFCHFWTPETRATIMLDRIAKKQRKEGKENVYGPNEVKEQRLTPKEIGITLMRPFQMFLREPIVLCLSLLSGFSDALIFTFIESFTPVYKQWGFSTEAIGLAFFPLLIGYIIAYFSFFPFIIKQTRIRKRDPDALAPEQRLYWLLWTVPLLPLGLFAFAWSSRGPQYTPWIVPMLFSSLVGIANFTIYMATIDYMIEAYGPYSASATGGNGFARDFLAGVATMYATPLYSNLGNENHLAWASTLLGCLGVLVAIPVYVFYWKGPQIRARSKFAQTLASDRKGMNGKRLAKSSEA